jgi:hypothetical protein
MQIRPETAEEGPFSWLERWAPEEAHAWAAWRGGLSASARADALVPMQAALAGLAALSRSVASEQGDHSNDCRAHAYALEVTLDWVLALADACRAHNRSLEEPDAALMALKRSVRHALDGARGTSPLYPIDRETLARIATQLATDLERNRFFRPPAPLEFCNVEDLFGRDHPDSDLQPQRDPQSTAAIVIFLSLLRSHRYLGVADREIAEEDGLYRAHVVLAGTLCELLALSRFVRAHGADSFPRDPEAAEALSLLLAQSVRAARRERIPAPTATGGLALPAERLRNTMREMRALVKRSARRVRDLAAPRRVPRASERVPKDLSPEIWSFRLIARAFLDKAEAAASRPDAWADPESLVFACEFARHFRKFGPRLAKGTNYDRRGPLVAAVRALSNREGIDPRKLGLAAHECSMFVRHLDGALDEARRLGHAAFDKREAAQALLGYLAESSRRSARAAAGVFGQRAGETTDR